jgi:hypothetical protein
LIDNQIHINQTIAISRKVAFLTFGIASILLLVFYFTAFNGMIYFSMLFTIAALFINTLYFVKLALLFKEKMKTKQILLSLFVMLLNIPIGLLYLEIGLKIYSHSNPN